MAMTTDIWQAIYYANDAVQNAKKLIDADDDAQKELHIASQLLETALKNDPRGAAGHED